MSNSDSDNPDELREHLSSTIMAIAEYEKVKLFGVKPSHLFERLIVGLHYKYNKPVVILIDEYDSPILDHIEEPKIANQMRETLSKFYGALKKWVGHRHFVFITGVSRFSKTSIFSGLNNLVDLTHNPEYANILGFTIDELDSIFKNQMEETLKKLKSVEAFDENATVDDLRTQVLGMYNGYSWDGRSAVLNPWSTLNFFQMNNFSNYWFESGTPSFLRKLIASGQMSLNGFFNSPLITDEMNIINIGQKINIQALLFQTGYLTIDWIESPGKFSKYYLRPPNVEVESSMVPLFTQSLLDADETDDTIKFYLNDTEKMRMFATATVESLFNLDATGFQQAFRSFLSGIPYLLIIKDEKYFGTIILLLLYFARKRFLSPKMVSGVISDFVLRTSDNIDFVIEMKHVNLSPNGIDLSEDDGNKLMKAAAKRAFKQIDEKKYYYSFQGNGNKIYKTALVVGGREEVMIEFQDMGKGVDVILEFQEAPNWKLALDKADGKFKVKMTGPEDA
jgi:hypothetical protein